MKHRLVLITMLVSLLAGSGQAAPAAEQRLEFQWPPEVGQPYPDLELPDHTGRIVRLSSFKGKLILLEPVGMSCPACQAFLGANQQPPGPYGGISPQSNLPSIEEALATYGMIQLPRRDIVHVQLLLFNLEEQTPSLEEAKRWAKHFGVTKGHNQYVLGADARFKNRASAEMIPGFHLIDREFILRADSTGHRPQHDLWRGLIPLLKQLAHRR